MGNILVRAGDEAIKIIDVGNAKLDFQKYKGLHRSSSVGGSRCYFSPERLNDGPFNEKDDIWTSACLLSELATGKLICRFDAAGSDGCLFATPACKELRRAVTDEVIRISPTLGSIVKYIWAHDLDPHARPSARDILNEYFSPEFEVPNAFCCSITNELMVDPVICSDGHSYERKAITQWFQNQNTSPMTNIPLTSLHLTPNIGLRNAILAFRDKRRLGLARKKL